MFLAVLLSSSTYSHHYVNIRSGAFACLICVQGLTPNKFRIVAVEEEPLCTPHLIRGAASCWGVRESSGDAVRVPADALVLDRVSEVVLIVVEAG